TPLRNFDRRTWLTARSDLTPHYRGRVKPSERLQEDQTTLPTPYAALAAVVETALLAGKVYCSRLDGHQALTRSAPARALSAKFRLSGRFHQPASSPSCGAVTGA